MPWHIVKQGSQWCVVKNSDGKNVGCSDSEDKAKAHLAALYANEKMSDNYISHQYGFDPFASLEGVLTGKPFKILPQGVFYRGDRTLDISESILRDIASNVKLGLPKFRIPINQDHKQDAGKVGTIQDVEYLPTGEDGAGLYATKYELTDKGRKLIADDGYDAPSAELVWTKNDGQKYQDPETGIYHDNILVGCAITPTPYFGHGNVSLYSATKNKVADANLDNLTQLEKEVLSELFREFDTEQRKTLAKSGAAMADGSYPIENAGDLSNAIHAIGRGKGSHAAIKAHIIKRARALGKTDMLPEDWSSSMSTDTMGSPTQNDVHAAGADASDKEDETPAEEAKKKKKGSPEEEKEDAMSDKIVTAEEFDALKTKADNFEATLKKQADEFTAKLVASDERAKKAEEFAQAERKTRTMNELAHTAAEKFSNLPIKAEEFAEKFYAVSEVNPEAAKWFSAKFEEFDTLIAQGALFKTFSRTDVDPTAETLSNIADRILAEKFGGDNKKRVEALAEAGKLRPDLARAGLMNPDAHEVNPSPRTTVRYK